MNQKRVDLLIQYVLAVAAQGWGDYGDREIGPIHIIKYVYLTDLAYATKHDGETYTGIPWKFHHFGPWSVELFKRIEPAALAIGAHKRTITDTPYDDFDRWSLDDDHLQNELAEQIGGISLATYGYFRRFGMDTYDLLDYVYSTVPMLHAAPGELLAFDIAAEISKQDLEEQEKLKQYHPEKLTARAQKKKKQAFNALKKKIQTRIAENKKQRRENYVTPTPPRYDDLFLKGQEWLDSLAGEPVEPQEGELTVSEDIWKSASRTESHV
ncbi:MAG TPA: hypothetical protein ENN18_04295 [Proteobacteria bacterium]|nr:hypothetical protein [Pseudomonadota bacterium]